MEDAEGVGLEDVDSAGSSEGMRRAIVARKSSSESRIASLAADAGDIGNKDMTVAGVHCKTVSVKR